MKWKMEFDVHLEIYTSDEKVKEMYQEYIQMLVDATVDIPGKETIKAKVYNLEGSEEDRIEV